MARPFFCAYCVHRTSSPPRYSGACQLSVLCIALYQVKALLHLTAGAVSGGQQGGAMLRPSTIYALGRFLTRASWQQSKVLATRTKATGRGSATGLRAYTGVLGRLVSALLNCSSARRA